jgi:hypothetical protein
MRERSSKGRRRLDTRTGKLAAGPLALVGHVIVEGVLRSCAAGRQRGNDASSPPDNAPPVAAVVPVL